MKGVSGRGLLSYASGWSVASHEMKRAELCLRSVRSSVWAKKEKKSRGKKLRKRSHRPQLGKKSRKSHRRTDRPTDQPTGAHTCPFMFTITSKSYGNGLQTEYLTRAVISNNLIAQPENLKFLPRLTYPKQIPPAALCLHIDIERHILSKKLT